MPGCPASAAETVGIVTCSLNDLGNEMRAIIHLAVRITVPGQSTMIEIDSVSGPPTSTDPTYVVISLSPASG
jgi:hypothetical protein